MGAISSTDSLPVLRRHLTDPERAVRETCEIALAKIEWDQTEEGRRAAAAAAEEHASVSRFAASWLAIVTPHVSSRAYTSIDPAPPTSSLLRIPAAPTKIADVSVPALREQLLDTTLPLFTRYRAMFSLRNIGTPDAVDALASGFSDSSDLFKCVPFGSLVNSPTHHALHVHLLTFLDTRLRSSLASYYHRIRCLRFSPFSRTTLKHQWSATRPLRHSVVLPHQRCAPS